MSAVIPGTFQEGRVVLETPVDWPEGAKVKVTLVASGERIGLTEDEWSDTPEAIEAWLRWYDSLEPLEFTPEEEADIAAWRQKIEEYTIANMHKGVEELFE